jgi:FkbM family methyltransferase
MTLPEFVYTVLLKPRPLRAVANATLRALTPAVVERYGAHIHLNPQDPVVSGALALRVYEKPETRFFLNAIQPGATFLDVGANIGYYSALALAHIGPHGRVVSVEPDPEAFGYLQRTVVANGGERATLVNKGLADVPGTLRLYRNASNRGDNRLYANDLAGSFVEVEVARADDVLAGLGIDQVDLIKMDVQGFEGKVLSGLERTIRNSDSLVLLSEFWPWGLREAGSDPLEVLGRLQGLGLQLHELTADGSTVPLTDHAAFIGRYTGRKYANIVARRKPAKLG